MVGKDHTEWIRCERGVKQGCVLSPLLFAIYISDLGTRLATTPGVKIGDTFIPALFFADDMALTSESEDDLMKQLAILKKFTDERRLEINFGKTEIMKIGLGSSKEKIWVLTDETGTETGRISETNFYDYLGIRIGRSRTFQQHMKRKLNQIPRKIGLLKVKAKNTPSRTRAADALWRQAVKPALLYGAEIVPYTKEWVTKMERTQNKIGRWTLGVGPSTPACGVRAELGWRSIENEIGEKKTAFWERLVRLPEERWAKQALNETLEGNYRCEWYQDVQKARAKVNAQMASARRANWREQLRRAWRKKEEKDWQQARELSTKLGNHPKDSVFEPDQYVWEDSKTSKTLTRLRLGDIGKQWGPEKGECKECKQDNINNIVEHVLLDCKGTKDMRNTGPVGQIIYDCQLLLLNRQDTIREILGGTDKPNRTQLLEFVKEWERKQQTMGDE
jgi:hypothetical protein